MGYYHISLEISFLKMNYFLYSLQLKSVQSYSPVFSNSNIHSLCAVKLLFSQFFSPVILNQKVVDFRTTRFSRFLSSCIKISEISVSFNHFFSHQSYSAESSVILNKCTFENIASSAMGGAIFIDNTNCVFEIADCDFVMCQCSTSGSLGPRTDISGGGYAVHVKSSMSRNVCFYSCISKLAGVAFYSRTPIGGNNQISYAHSNKCGMSNSGNHIFLLEGGLCAAYNSNCSNDMAMYCAGLHYGWSPQNSTTSYCVFYRESTPSNMFWTSSTSSMIYHSRINIINNTNLNAITSSSNVYYSYIVVVKNKGNFHYGDSYATFYQCSSDSTVSTSATCISCSFGNASSTLVPMNNVNICKYPLKTYNGFLKNNNMLLIVFMIIE